MADRINPVNKHAKKATPEVITIQEQIQEILSTPAPVVPSVATDSRNALEKKGNDFFMPSIQPANQVVYQLLEPGAITDGLVTANKNGGMVGATITKNGNFDKIAISGGDVSAYISFPNKITCDIEAIFKLSVKVENLNADGVSGKSYISFGTNGVQASDDTGSNLSRGVYFDLIGKTGTQRGSSSWPLLQKAASTGALVSNGDILDISYFPDYANNGIYFQVINRTTGAYYIATINKTNGFSVAVSTDLCPHTGYLMLGFTNATYTILSYSVSAKETKGTLVASIGDSLGHSYNTIPSATLIPKMHNQSPYGFVSFNGNGSYWNAIPKFQVPDVLKLRAKYVLVISFLAAYYDAANTGNGRYPTFLANFQTTMNAIIAYGGVPIVFIWNPNNSPLATTAAINNYNNFVLNQKATLYPTMQTLDLRTTSLQYSDFFGHLTDTDWNAVFPLLLSLLNTLESA